MQTYKRQPIRWDVKRSLVQPGGLRLLSTATTTPVAGTATGDIQQNIEVERY